MITNNNKEQSHNLLGFAGPNFYQAPACFAFSKPLQGAVEGTTT